MVNPTPRMYAALSQPSQRPNLTRGAVAKSPRLMPAAVTVLAVSSVVYYVRRQLLREKNDFDAFFAQKHKLADQLLQEDNKKVLAEVNAGQKNLLNILSS
ncbi:hypothetical protein DL770_006170 [Monosporascus sp. CRB-9-2]|nr:hypothetical protein DL770_006170 [Monosporascus sp. CRB-9-2]